MTKRERARIARRNGALSRGPTSIEGRDRARRSALKHGLTATILALQGESAEEIQSHADFWLDAYQPETPTESVACAEGALATLHLERFHKAHNAILADQVRYAPTNWDQERMNRLSQAISQLQTDPEAAVRQLKSFGLGVDWLIARWNELLECFQKQGCWNNIPLIHEAIRLFGRDPKNLSSEPMVTVGYEVLLLATHAGPEPRDERLIRQLQEQMPPAFLGLHGRPLAFDRATAQTQLQAFITRHIAELQELSVEFEPLDAQSRAEASVRAMAPADTPLNRLLLRYLTAASSALSRSTKQLEAFKAARLKAAIAAEEAALEDAEETSQAAVRNEPSAAEAPSYPASANGVYASKKDEKVGAAGDGSDRPSPLEPAARAGVQVSAVSAVDLAPLLAA